MDEMKSILSLEPYVLRQDMKKHRYMDKDGKTCVRETAFYDRKAIRYNDKTSEYETFKKGVDGKHDPKKGVEVWEIFLWTKSSLVEDKQTTVDRKIIERKQVIDGETKFIDDRDYYKPAYDKYLDFKKKGCKDKTSLVVEDKTKELKAELSQEKLEKEAMRLQIAELQKQAKLKDIVQKPISITKNKVKENDSTDNISKHRKGR